MWKWKKPVKKAEKRKKNKNVQINMKWKHGESDIIRESENKEEKESNSICQHFPVKIKLIRIHELLVANNNGRYVNVSVVTEKNEKNADIKINAVVVLLDAKIKSMKIQRSIYDLPKIVCWKKCGKILLPQKVFNQL